MQLPHMARCDKVFSPKERLMANVATLLVFVVLNFILPMRNMSWSMVAPLLLAHFLIANLLLRRSVSRIPNDGRAFDIRTVVVNFFRESWGFALAPLLPSVPPMFGIGTFGRPVVASLMLGEVFLFCCFEGLALGFMIENAKVYSRGSTGYFIASWLTYGFYYGFSLLPALTSCVVSNP